ncbi:MAG TPA: MFS transporter, partial [Syntrophomonadaceae bacterium]|nr:MFS transporter [Syntrophomonadaceae bacterium]
LNTMRLVGQTLSMSIATLLISVYVGSASLAQTSSASLMAWIQVSFLVFAVLCLIGILPSLIRGSLHDDTPMH